VEFELENHDVINIYCHEQTALEEDILSKEDCSELQTVPYVYDFTDILSHENPHPV
jgi:hypothetical protein